jgi:hypothetical protein
MLHVEVSREAVREFIFGYATKVGACNVLNAELWGISHDLHFV